MVKTAKNKIGRIKIMYYYVEGKLAHKESNLAVIDCAGVGYKLIISLKTSESLPELGGTVRLYTHLVVREDLLELIGFIDLYEKSVFQMLLSVSGVGIKVAMAVLSALTAERFAFAVAKGDYAELSLAQGVSTKTAQKIIIELKDKIAKDMLGKKTAAAGGRLSASDIGAAPMPAHRDAVSDVLEALIVLGYSKNEARNVIASEDLDRPIEDIIKSALVKLSSKA